MLEYEIYLKIKRGEFKEGNICKYIRYRGLNLKCYEDRWERDRCYLNQKKLSLHGFAPKAFERFSIYKYYCYTTEHIENILEESDNYLIESFCDKVYYATGFNIVDPQPQNFGVKNGKLFLIDCE